MKKSPSASEKHPCYSILEKAPQQAGVYQMFNDADHIIYIGKASSLKQRLASYFRLPSSSPKTTVLMSRVKRIECIVTENEQEALLLEANLIKEHKPRYNVLLKDDKSYPYLYLNTDDDFPRLDFYRGSRAPRGRYFGPYPNAGAVREMLSWVQKLFKLRQCSKHFFSARTRPCLQYAIKRCTAPCCGLVSKADYDTQVQQACRFLTGKRAEIIKLLEEKMQQASKSRDYEQAVLFRDQIKDLHALQSLPTVAGSRGDVDVLALAQASGHAAISLLIIRAGHVVGHHHFLPKVPQDADEQDVLSAFLAQYYLQAERAQNPPQRIIIDRQLASHDLLQKAFNTYCQQAPTILLASKGVEARWQEMAAANVQLFLKQHLQKKDILADQLVELQRVLKLPGEVELIECFDISHTQGEETVASCVVCEGGAMNRRAYRRFNIKAGSITAADDYAALHQAMSRRYSRQKREGRPLPDLLLIDGGKGQLTQAEKVFEELQISGVWLLAISKGPQRLAGEEKLHLSGKKQVIELPATSPALHLLQRIRDEAHRFAITGHRKKRNKNFLQSKLQQIPGIGKVRRQLLLQYFAGMQGVQKASRQQLAAVPGISKSLAEQIYNALHCDD